MSHAERLSLRVREMRWEAERVLSVVLEESSGAPLPAWDAGAHIDVELPNGIERQYSLCSMPGERTWRIAVLREEESRGSSSHVHESLRPGDLVSASHPRNNLPLVDADEYVFIAGGIGITPLLALVASARARGARVRFAYLGRSRDRMAFLDHDALSGAELVIGEEGRRLDLEQWIGSVADGTAIYACGPNRLLDELEELSRGWPSGALHIERFQPRELVDTDLSSFEVECRRSGIVVTVPEDASILETLESAGIPMPSSCREGVCGTCELSIIDGVAEHRDSLLTPDEREANTSLLVCVSRAACPRLVLDV